ISDVWTKYKQISAQSDELKKLRNMLRNELIEMYLHLVRYQAERVHVKLPNEVELDDLMSAGVFGLIDAIDSFDPERKIKFETFAAIRIRGAMMDELRYMDWVPRLVRQRFKLVETARNQLENELNRDPTNEEIQKRLNISAEEFQKIIDDSQAPEKFSLSTKRFTTDTDKDVTEGYFIANEDVDDPEHEVDGNILRELILRGLEPKAKLVVELYHFYGYTMKEIADILFISESRVSKMHSNAIQQLKANGRLQKLAKSASWS
ncbi:MAG: fliA, partial [Candidatus Paceibacter sp.]|nr:fliA [Candidatus Paceibacter sp.]